MENGRSVVRDPGCPARGL